MKKIDKKKSRYESLSHRFSRKWVAEWKRAAEGEGESLNNWARQAFNQAAGIKK